MGIVLVSCSPPKKWECFFYPQGKKYNVIKKKPFNSEKECLAWAQGFATKSDDDYDCKIIEPETNP